MSRLAFIAGCALLAGACDGGASPATREVLARPYDRARACLGPRERIGTVPAGVAGRPSVWCLVDEAGRGFVVYETIAPPGFAHAASDDPRCPASATALPLCS